MRRRILPHRPGTGPTPTPGYPVSGVVFYDENGNGVLDPGEVVRLPGVTVSVGGRTGQTGAGGPLHGRRRRPRARSRRRRGRTACPAYFVPGAAAAVDRAPAGGDIAVPATLPVGSQQHAERLPRASATASPGARAPATASGYLSWLAADLRSAWGKADTVNDGVPGTKSNKGETRMGSSLARNRTAWVLILYGTNDYNDSECRNALPCYTIDSLRSMIQQTRDAGALPVLGTIPPVNPNYEDKGAADRNLWVKSLNDLVRAMASQERVPVAEVYGDFLKQPSLPGALQRLPPPERRRLPGDRAVLLQGHHDPAVREQRREAAAAPLRRRAAARALRRRRRSDRYPRAWGGSMIAAMKTGRLLKFHRPGGDVHAYLYQEAGAVYASVYLLAPGQEPPPGPRGERRGLGGGGGRRPGLGRGPLPETVLT